MLRPGGVLPPGSVVGGNGRFYTIEEVLGTGSNAVTYREEAVGASLGNMISEGMRCTDAEATRIGIELLRILSYLSSLRPPVVHRDVKPENIILEGGRWGGRVYLVDFGGVQGAAMSAMEPSSLGSTIIGTYGYMAPEQFRGAAQPASDVYAAGATLLFLLSGRPPSAFPQERMRIRWRGSPDAPGLQPPSPRWATVLDGLLEPLAEDRLSATEALDILEGRTEVDRQQTDERTPESSREQRVPRTGRSTFQRKKSLARRPAGTRVELERTPSRLDIVIPPKLARQALGGALVKERIAIGQQKFRIGQELAVFRDGSVDFLGARNTRVVEGLTSDIQGARIITSVIVNGVPQTVIEVLEGIRKHRFGEGLELMEQQWLVQEINSHVEALGSTVDVDSLPPPEAPAVFNDDPEAAN
ncbi:kinase-like domain-containing protein [Dunaliella salina]|uniref:non-specific serine/threonine protein kinase n=1 Tax=Dunaliella salina TaxID=3046 RepID=A0ABQ7GCW0_DUNSA|nr:kinase-like domain-containing protein [Dunaliella salina]|eukprot:KAF5832434.1 kinase-like domain-containing protein [Dunaliella salina]